MARQIHGVDIIDAAMVSGVDNYLKVIPGDSNCLEPIPAASIEAVFVLFYCGFQPHSKWRSYVSHNDRLEAYLEPRNFLRVISPGGYLIVCEWEAAPEKRWDKASLSTIDQRASIEYDPPEIAGFELVLCGFAKATRSPFVVYRRI